MAAYLRSAGGMNIDPTVIDYLQKLYEAAPNSENSVSIKQTLDATSAALMYQGE